MLKILVPSAVALVALLAATNPHEDAHARAMVSHAQKGCGDDKLSQLLCGGATALASLGVVYEDHLLYSTAHLGQTETIGVLGKVFILSE